MNDIKKLHQVIDALEEQSSRVTEFNGVLSAVNSAREKIESAKTLLAKLSDDQKWLVSQNYKCFEEYGERLSKLESQVTSLGELQNKTLKEIAALEFVTPEQHEQGLANTEKAVSEQLALLIEKVNAATVVQQHTIKLLQKIVLFGVLALASGIVFLARDAFM